MDANFRSRRLTTESLFAGNNPANKTLRCSFCQYSHFSDKCTAVTNWDARMEIMRKNKLCFRCLNSHYGGIKNCKSRAKCFKCQSFRHHTALCNPDSEKSENLSNRKYQYERKNDPNQNENDTTNMMVAVPKKVEVILQTANAIAADNSERNKKRVRILLDPGSQRNYLTEKLAKGVYCRKM